MIEAQITVYCQPKTVADVRQWLAEVDSLGLPDTTKLDDGLLYLYTDSKRTEFIECGEHVPESDGAGGFTLPRDLLVYMHDCRTDGFQEEKPE